MVPMVEKNKELEVGKEREWKVPSWAEQLDFECLLEECEFKQQIDDHRLMDGMFLWSSNYQGIDQIQMCQLCVHVGFI